MAPAKRSSDTFKEKYGPWAIVIGASDGIGRALAREIAARGLSVVLVARRRDRLDEVAREIEADHKVSTRIVVADLALPGSAARVMADAKGLDLGLLAACAGFGTGGRALDIPIADELAMVDINCRAAFEMTRLCAERLAARGRGGIILMSSIVAFQGVPHAANYTATKAYIQTLAEGLHPDLARAGIDVLASAPGPVESGFATRAGMTMGRADRPAVVARDTVAALGSRTTVRPGSLGKLLGISLSTLPRFVRAGVMESIMKGMTTHHGR